MSWFHAPKSAQPRRPLDARPIAAEIIECRSLLNGNVTATLVDGVLTLSGDRRSNELAIQIDPAGTVTFASPNTTINGQPAANVQLPGSVNSIVGSFGRGRDRVVIEGVVETTGDNALTLPTLSGDVSIDMGRGRDGLTVRGLQIDGQLTASGGRHRDQVTIESVNANALGISGGRGRDTLAVRDVDVDGDVGLSGGRGRDRLVLGDDVTVAGQTNVSGGRGRDRSVNAATDNATRVDRYFEQATGGQASADTQEAWNRSNDLLFTNSIDSSAFPTTFPTIEPEQFTTSDTGLRYRIIESGSETRPTATDNVTVQFQGLLTDGTQFDGTTILNGGGFDPDDSVSRDLGTEIVGWQEGLPMIGEGGRIQLLVPPALAFGSVGTDGVPADASLFFNIELLTVN